MDLSTKKKNGKNIPANVRKYRAGTNSTALKKGVAVRGVNEARVSRVFRWLINKANNSPGLSYLSDGGKKRASPAKMRRNIR
jgi:hypothetical protein